MNELVNSVNSNEKEKEKKGKLSKINSNLKLT